MVDEQRANVSCNCAGRKKACTSVHAVKGQLKKLLLQRSQRQGLHILDAIGVQVVQV